MRVLHSIRDHGDLVFALTLAVAMQLEVWFSDFGAQRPWASLAALLATLPLALRRRYPLAVFLLTWLGIGALTRFVTSFDEESFTLIVAFVFTLYSYGANARGRQAWAAIVLIPLLIANFVSDDGDAFQVGDIAFGAMIVAGPWLAGLAIRLRRQSERRLTLRTVELERDQEEKARAAVAAERARIARELHDVVAHAISVVVVQARGGRKVLDRDTAAARGAFDSIEQTGEQALGEMRRLLGMLRDDDDELSRAPQPSLSRLDALAEHVRASGLPVEVEVDGEPAELPPGVDLAAYRIVQEALTNTLKHAGPAIARVRVSYRPDEVEVSVTDDGRGDGDGGGTGNGLVGIRERVAVVGGALEAGPQPGGGYAVRARLPYGEPA